MTRRIAVPALLSAVLALSSCSDLSRLIDPPEFSDARIEVDPTIIRTIHHSAVNGTLPEPAEEVTTKRIDEIECLRRAPWCSVSEVIQVTVHNEGTRTLLWHHDNYDLERHGLGAWYRMNPWATLAVQRPPIEIPPGENRTSRVWMGDMPPGLYRIKLGLVVHLAVFEYIPEDMRTSPAFYFQPLPDYRPFQCPSENRAERAAQIARERLERSLTVGPNPGHDDWTLQIENQIPGFGGVYLGNGAVNVLLEDLSRSSDAKAWAQSHYGRAPLIHKADHSFSELLGWREVLFGYVLGLPAWHTFGIDLVRNRVKIELTNPLDRADAECIAPGIGAPEGIFTIGVVGS
jgi:hypothetical protein